MGPNQAWIGFRTAEIIHLAEACVRPGTAMPEAPANVRSLHQITRLPLDFTHQIYSHYPGAKLGVRKSTRHYAGLLVPLAEEVLMSMPRQTPFVLTAPALLNIPAAANYICGHLFQHLVRSFAGSLDLTLVEIRASRPGSPTRPSYRRDDYSRLDAGQRLRSRRREVPNLIVDERFRGHAVLFINDINVTGAQQQCMRRYFDSAGAAGVYWLYILDVDPVIGRSNPAIEHMINSASHSSFEEFAALIWGEEMDYTGKCLARLFSYSSEQLESLFAPLSGDRIHRILDYTLREGAVAAEEFDRKLALLRSRAASLHTPA